MGSGLPPHQCSAYVLDEVGEPATVADIKEAEVIRCTGSRDRQGHGGQGGSPAYSGRLTP